MPNPFPLPIREAAALLGVSAHTLRYYEREGLLTVPRAAGGERRYTERELDMLRFLLRLRATGMGMAGLRDYVALARQGDGTVAARRELLVRHEQAVVARLEALQADLEAIRHKIEKYDRQHSPLTHKETA
ncbi:transcriptional regulator, MerR family [Deinococcus aerius]|uniref:Transcriptional regulator, MerR family n=1 Tax=Deinococcus aerius TaxID=200253 RepID=A0A2I9CUT2_9DEIO|nr:MerR family transcriptional regulator [Deinococcus aerius]GBF05629.1 transcriptional regulator, MerR family [Deinococcus aerius]